MLYQLIYLIFCRKAFQTMCSAYNRTIYPTQILKNILLYDSIDVLLSDLEYYGIYQTNQINRESVLFTKISFLGSKGTVSEIFPNCDLSLWLFKYLVPYYTIDRCIMFNE